MLNDTPSGAGAFVINANNPYLPASAKGTIINYLNTVFGGLGGLWAAQGAPGVPPLSAVVPGFGVDLSKNWAGLLPSYSAITDTDTLRALFALDGTFNFVERDFDWNVSASRGHSQSTMNQDNVVVEPYDQRAQRGEHRHGGESEHRLRDQRGERDRSGL